MLPRVCSTFIVKSCMAGVVAISFICLAIDFPTGYDLHVGVNNKVLGQIKQTSLQTASERHHGNTLSSTGYASAAVIIHGRKAKPGFGGFSELMAIVQAMEAEQSSQWNFSLSATKYAIDRMNVTLPLLLKSYRNPCWIEYLSPLHSYADSYYLIHDCMEHSAVYKSLAWSHYTNYERRKNSNFYRLRCFPYFYLLGVAKSGTTDLYISITRYLKQVISGARKEPHFWNRRRLSITTAGSCYNEPGGYRAEFSDYLDLYDEASEKIRLRPSKDKASYHPLITGDFTPATLFSSPRWWTYPGNEGQAEPRYTTADYLHSLSPNAKLIVILRDPIERAYSQMRYRSLPIDGHVARAFHRLVIDTLSSLQECTNLRGCVYNRTNPDAKDAAQNEIIIPGLYAIFIRDWLKVFPRKQFIFLRFEDYIKDRIPSVDRVASFLGIDPLSPVDRETLYNKNISNYGFDAEPIWPDTRRLLQEFYRPWNKQLAQILHNDDFLWGY